MAGIQSILQEFRINYRAVGQHRNVRDGWIGIDCPWCGKGNGKYHLGVNLRTGYVTCWRCGPKTIADVLIELTNQQPSTIYKLLSGIEWDKPKTTKPNTNGTLKIPNGVGPMMDQHRSYIQERGLDPDEMERLWGVKGIGISSRLSWRLWIPIHLDGEIVSWTTRSLIEESPHKYIKAKLEEESIPASTILYGADYARHHAVIVHEGPIDVWATGPGAVGLLGLNCSSEQLNLISRYLIRVICFDSEPAAQKRAEKLAEDLKLFPGETHIVSLETGKDSAEADKEEVADLRHQFLENY